MMPAKVRWLVLLVVSSALALIVIDMTVLYTALPSLTYDLKAGAAEKMWIVTVYGLVVAGLLPGFGALGDRFGHKKTFIAGLMIFGIASLVAAYSPTALVLIIGRVLLAVGAALMMPATLSLIRLSFSDGRERALAIGLWGAVASSGAAVGPLVGGVLLEYFWWGSVFLINVPLVVAALIPAYAWIPDTGGRPDRTLDLIGSGQIMAGLIGFAYCVEEVGGREPSLWTLTPIAAATIGIFVVFVRRQLRTASPLIEFSLFRNSDFSCAVLTAVVAAAVISGTELALTQRLQLVLDHSPLQAALYILPAPIGAFLGGPVAGLMLRRIGVATAFLATLLIAGFGIGGFALWSAAGPVAQQICIGINGFGLGAAMAIASGTIMNRAPAGREGMAASIEEVSFELGGSIGISVFGSMLAGVYAHRLELPAELAAHADVGDGIDEALALAVRLPAALASELVEKARGAFDHAFFTVIVVATVLLIGAAIVTYLGLLLSKPSSRPRHDH